MVRVIPRDLPALIGKCRFKFSWSQTKRYGVMESTNGVWPLPLDGVASSLREVRAEPFNLQYLPLEWRFVCRKKNGLKTKCHSSFSCNKMYLFDDLIQE